MCVRVLTCPPDSEARGFSVLPEGGLVSPACGTRVLTLGMLKLVQAASQTLPVYIYIYFFIVSPCLQGSCVFHCMTMKMIWN